MFRCSMRRSTWSVVPLQHVTYLKVLRPVSLRKTGDQQIPISFLASSIKIVGIDREL